MRTSEIIQKLGLSLVVCFALAAFGSSGCGGCLSDPCEGVECPPGEICIRGECVLDEQWVGCRRDEDCADIQGRTRCEVVSGNCVECLVTAHCPNPRRQICDRDENYCVPRPPCESDGDCSDLPSSPHCNAETGECVGCLSDAHCEGRQQRCDIASSTCHFEPCQSDDDCTAYHDAPHCHTGSGLCQQCTHDGHCAEYEICRNGLCLPRGECQSDSECGVAERCNTLTQACVQCVSTADCRLGGRCISSTCRAAFSCETDADCGAPLRCAAESSTCHECTRSEHCATGQVCEGGRCFGSQSCGPGVFCGPGEECLDGSCAWFTCPDDGLGAGPVPYQAAPSEPGLVDEISLCPNTWHWFVYDARVRDGLIVDLSYQTTLDHPDLLVWAGTGTGAAVLGEPAITETGQRIEVSLLSRAGPVWIGVRGINEHLMASLEVEVVPGGLCEDDEYEPNHSPELAVRLPDTVAGTTSIEAIACFGNEDWFYLPVPEQLRTVAVAETTGEGTNPLMVSLHVRDNDGTMRLIGGDGTHVAEAAPRESQADVYVRIKNMSSGGRPYRLEVRLRPRLPPNDDCDGIELLPGAPRIGTTAGANDSTRSACGGEGSPDVVYRFNLLEPKAVNIVAEGPLDTILSLRSVCDDESTEVLCSDVPGQREEIDAVLPPGDWYVWVDGHDGREGEFEITLQTQAAPPSPPNDSCETALELDVDQGGGVEIGNIATATDEVTSSCGEEGGDAFYSLTIEEPTYLFAELNASFEMSLSIRGSCEEDESELLCAEIMQDGTATMEMSYLEAGAYTLVVDGGGPARRDYELVWGLGSPVLPPANDSCDTASLLDLASGRVEITADTSGASDAHEATCSLPGMSGPDVVYRIDLLEEASLEAVLHPSFDGVLELRGQECSSALDALSCSDHWPPRIFEPILPAGTYHLLIDGYSGDRGPFDLFVRRGRPLSSPANDTCEHAETIDTSSLPATLRGYTWLSENNLYPGLDCTGYSLDGPDVVYAVDLAASETLVATVVPEPGFDPAIYLLESCDFETCLVGADDFFVSRPETISYTAQQGGRYYVVVDAWHPEEAGFFELIVDIQ